MEEGGGRLLVEVNEIKNADCGPLVVICILSECKSQSNLLDSKQIYADGRQTVVASVWRWGERGRGCFETVWFPEVLEPGDGDGCALL